MTYQAHIGSGGLAGWDLLNRTASRQRQLVANDRETREACSQFRDRIGAVTAADELVSDYRLMKVALGAFGLEGDIASKAFIRKVLESDLSDQSSLANRLSNKAYRRLSEAFGFTRTGDEQSSAGFSSDAGFADSIIARYVNREFEARVGDSDQNLRLALNARREMAEVSARSGTNNTKWYEVLGNIPLRRVFEGAFGFGHSYGRLPIDRQMEEFSEAASRLFGTDDMRRIAQPENVEKLIRTFLARGSVTSGDVSNRFSTALTLLSTAPLSLGSY
ncbi:DUF1217 domain-containing protein [Paracoccus aerodenitrificans]|uniref:DUF1217 domain-containing protein n=1 Tax=Paracoccus aerodenitrificans TaxID=3017781 RepID=UPI0022F018B7|nr:DUF1217 domain-containing protein [Paracoccus aerodenitrificans]WBU64305.1 DUF1217 domain-containing protein [Paracoccus aerodenitrificans]